MKGDREIAPECQTFIKPFHPNVIRIKRSNGCGIIVQHDVDVLPLLIGLAQAQTWRIGWGIRVQRDKRLIDRIGCFAHRNGAV